MRVLVVEDDPDHQDLLAYTIGRVDEIELIMAVSAEEAMEIDWTSLDAACVDYMLGGDLDGVVLAVMMRAAKLPTAVASAHVGGASRRMSELNAKIPIIPKPIALPALLVAWGLDLK